MNNKLKVSFLSYQCYFNQFCFCMHSKQLLNYFAVSEGFFVLSMLSLYSIHNKNITVFRASFQLTSRALLDPSWFWHTFCVTQRLKNVPCNYRTMEKPLFAALNTLWCLIERGHLLGTEEYQFNSGVFLVNFYKLSLQRKIYSKLAKEIPLKCQI